MSARDLGTGKQQSITITKIAMLCGFGSSNYFKDLFRASTGRSPREYRKHSGLPIHPHLRDNG